MNKLLEVRNLKVAFPMEGEDVCAVRGVDFEIREGESVALVGESGCGKSVTALSLLRLVGGDARVTSDRMMLGSRELMTLTEDEIRNVRGAEIGMIFQEPMTSLNPVIRVGDQIAEVFKHHKGLNHKEAVKEAIAALDRVGLASPEQRVRQYPHEMSGGMMQRVMIAMALSCNPALLIADEPTTALDVTIQSQILDLLSRLQNELGMAVLLITHDLGVVAHFSQRVLVMYAGEVVEDCDVRTLFREPRHPYTRALLAALPRRGDRDRLDAIEGNVPSPRELGDGCAFVDRCGSALDNCAKENPRSFDLGEQHYVRCWLYGDQH